MKFWPLALLCLGAFAARADDLGPVCTDRPGKGTSPCTVEAGHAQVELGLFDESFKRRSGVTTDIGNAGSAVAKYGISDRLDLEAGMALYQFQRVDDATGTATSSGVGDLYLHAKYLVSSGPLSFALDPYVKLPTAGGGLGNDHVEGGLVAPVSYDLGGGWSLAATPEADLLLDGSGGGYHASLVNVVELGKSIGAMTLGAEIWTSRNLDPAGTVSQVSADLSAAWLVNNDAQLDCGVNLGLNRATPDTEIYFGIARRF